MGIPKDLKRELMLQAIANLDAGKQTRWSKSRKYDLVHEGKRYPPKAVLGLAICHLKQLDEYAFDFSGGETTNSALRNLGFEIASKNLYAEK